MPISILVMPVGNVADTQGLQSAVGHAPVLTPWLDQALVSQRRQDRVGENEMAGQVLKAFKSGPSRIAHHEFRSF